MYRWFTSAYQCMTCLCKFIHYVIINLVKITITRFIWVINYFVRTTVNFYCYKYLLCSLLDLLFLKTSVRVSLFMKLNIH